MQTNYTKLADLYAIAKAEEDVASKKAKALREQILATGRETVVGDAYVVTVSLVEQTRLITGEVEKLLKPAQLAKCQKTTMSERLNVKAAPASAYAVAAE